MNDRCYCQYAFTQSGCRADGIGPGVDPRFGVELAREGQIAAVISRIGLDQFAPERLQGETAEDVEWLGRIAARHHEIICQAAASAAVLPLRLGTLFHSRDSLQAMLARCRSTVAESLQRLGNRQEWGVKLYLEKCQPERIAGHDGPPPPHHLGLQGTGTDYLNRRKTQLDSRRERRGRVHQTIQDVERHLASRAEHSCRVANLPSDLTGRTEEMVYNAAFLLPSSAQASWLETVQHVHRDVQRDGLVLEVSGPWPPYHFCPSLEL